MSELISVIVPVYNVENYVSECIASIIAQEYRNLEIILIDDGSTDKSGIICNEWGQKDERIRVIHQAHEGVSAARNTGLLECQGQLIGFVDADDWLEKGMYQILAETMMRSEADVVMCGYYFHLNQQRRPVENGTFASGNRIIEETFLCILKRKGYGPSPWNKLFRREVVFRNGKCILMDPNLSYGEDEAWLFEVLQNCKTISFVPQPLYHYRARKDSLSRKKELSEEKMSLLEAKKKSYELLPESDTVNRLFKANIYNCIYGLKVLSYIKKDVQNHRRIQEYLRPFRSVWIKSREIRPARKIKVFLLELCMKTRMPIAVVEKFDELRLP